MAFFSLSRGRDSSCFRVQGTWRSGPLSWQSSTGRGSWVTSRSIIHRSSILSPVASEISALFDIERESLIVDMGLRGPLCVSNLECLESNDPIPSILQTPPDPKPSVIGSHWWILTTLETHKGLFTAPLSTSTSSLSLVNIFFISERDQVLRYYTSLERRLLLPLMNHRNYR